MNPRSHPASGGSVTAASSDVSSCPYEPDGLDLGLGLSIRGRRDHPGTISTARDFPSSSCSSSSSSSRGGNGFAGHKRSAADSIEAANPLNNQVVGWPPVKAYRRNSLSNKAKLPAIELSSVVGMGRSEDAMMEENYYGSCNKGEHKDNGSFKTLFVKVNMDGIPIGRKIDLSAHACYQTLAQALEDMFHRPTMIVNTIQNGVVLKAARPFKLLDGSPEFVLTYEDKDGDLMLVGDVPWGMFLHSVKRLRIMRRSEADGLGAHII